MASGKSTALPARAFDTAGPTATMSAMESESRTALTDKTKIGGVADNLRRRKLGDWGEQLAMDLLQRRGFVDVVDLNRERSKEPNDRYKFQMDYRRHAAMAEKNRRAEAAWLAIPIDKTRRTYGAYFGLLSQLRTGGIPMTNRARAKYECLVSSAPLPSYCLIRPPRTGTVFGGR